MHGSQLPDAHAGTGPAPPAPPAPRPMAEPILAELEAEASQLCEELRKERLKAEVAGLKLKLQKAKDKALQAPKDKKAPRKALQAPKDKKAPQVRRAAKKDNTKKDDGGAASDSPCATSDEDGSPKLPLTLRS